MSLLGGDSNLDPVRDDLKGTSTASGEMMRRLAIVFVSTRRPARSITPYIKRLT